MIENFYAVKVGAVGVALCGVWWWALRDSILRRPPKSPKLEPRLSPKPAERFETRPNFLEVTNCYIEAGPHVAFITTPANADVEMLRRLLGPENRTPPLIEIHQDESRETLLDLSRRVTDEMLSLPIPSTVRALLMDLQDAGEMALASAAPVTLNPAAAQNERTAKSGKDFQT